MSGRLTRCTQEVFCVFFVCLIFFTPFSIAAVQITFPLLLVTWGLGGCEPPATTFPIERKILWALLFYFAVCFFSIERSKFLAISWIGFIGKTTKYSLIFLLASQAVKYVDIPSRSIRAILVGAWLVLFYGFWQEWAIYSAPYSAGAVDPIRGFTLGYVRMVGPYKNPNDLATYLMVISLLVIALVMESGRRLSLRRGALVFLMVGCLIWTGSRGAILGFAAGILLLFSLRHHRTKNRLGLAGILTIALGFLIFISRHHLKELLMLSDVASKERLHMWGTAWAMFRDRPIVGHGINTFMANYEAYAGAPGWPAYAHNCYLQIAAETGIVGLASFLYFISCLGGICWRALHQAENLLPPHLRELRPLLLGLAAGVLAFLLQSAFDTNLYAVRQAVLFWTFSGMILGISGLLQTKQSSSSYP